MWQIINEELFKVECLIKLSQYFGNLAKAVMSQITKDCLAKFQNFSLSLMRYSTLKSSSFIIIYLSFLNCDWLLIRELHWFYWTQELLVPVEKFTVRMPMVRLELATPGLQTQCSSHWAIQLKSYCWEGVEFIQLVYCIIIYLSFLNCDWLLIREVLWFYWIQELLIISPSASSL